MLSLQLVVNNRLIDVRLCYFQATASIILSVFVLLTVICSVIYQLQSLYFSLLYFWLLLILLYKVQSPVLSSFVLCSPPYPSPILSSILPWSLLSPSHSSSVICTIWMELYLDFQGLGDPPMEMRKSALERKGSGRGVTMARLTFVWSMLHSSNKWQHHIHYPVIHYTLHCAQLYWQHHIHYTVIHYTITHYTVHSYTDNIKFITL